MAVGSGMGKNEGKRRILGSRFALNIIGLTFSDII